MLLPPTAIVCLFTILHTCFGFHLEINLSDKPGPKGKVQVKLTCMPASEQSKVRGQKNNILWEGTNFGSADRSRLAALASSGQLMVPDMRINSSDRYRCALTSPETGHDEKKSLRKRVLRQLKASVPAEFGSCPPGYRLDQENCYPCFPGSYTSGQETECFLCPKDFYMSREAADSCWPCPEGRKTVGEGADSEDSCFFIDSAGKPVAKVSTMWIVIGICVLIFVICAWIIISLLIWRHWKKKKSKEKKRHDRKDKGIQSVKPLLPKDEKLLYESISEESTESAGGHIYEEIKPRKRGASEDSAYEVPIRKQKEDTYVKLVPSEENIYEEPIKHFMAKVDHNQSDSDRKGSKGFVPFLEEAKRQFERDMHLAQNTNGTSSAKRGSGTCPYFDHDLSGLGSLVGGYRKRDPKECPCAKSWATGDNNGRCDPGHAKSAFARDFKPQVSGEERDIGSGSQRNRASLMAQFLEDNDYRIRTDSTYRDVISFADPESETVAVEETSHTNAVRESENNVSSKDSKLTNILRDYGPGSNADMQSADRTSAALSDKIENPNSVPQCDPIIQPISLDIEAKTQQGLIKDESSELMGLNLKTIPPYKGSKSEEIKGISKTQIATKPHSFTSMRDYISGGITIDNFFDNQLSSGSQHKATEKDEFMEFWGRKDKLSAFGSNDTRVSSTVKDSKSGSLHAKEASSSETKSTSQSISTGRISGPEVSGAPTGSDAKDVANSPNAALYESNEFKRSLENAESKHARESVPQTRKYSGKDSEFDSYSRKQSLMMPKTDESENISAVESSTLSPGRKLPSVESSNAKPMTKDENSNEAVSNVIHSDFSPSMEFQVRNGYKSSSIVQSPTTPSMNSDAESNLSESLEDAEVRKLSVTERMFQKSRTSVTPPPLPPPLKKSSS